LICGQGKIRVYPLAWPQFTFKKTFRPWCSTVLPLVFCVSLTLGSQTKISAYFQVCHENKVHELLFIYCKKNNFWYFRVA